MDFRELGREYGGMTEFTMFLYEYLKSRIRRPPVRSCFPDHEMRMAVSGDSGARV
jgi:hypothetical protein